MNRSDTHRKAILLYCDRNMQTEPDSKPDSGNHPPLFPHYSPHPQAATGLGKTNIVNTIDVDSKVVLYFCYIC